MAYGWLLEAEYESGFVLREGPEDHSPYKPGENTFGAIRNGRPTEAGHGLLTRFSLVGEEHTFTIDWRTLWDVPEPQPVCEREMHSELYDDGTDSGPICDLIRFGYRHQDGDTLVEELYEITFGGVRPPASIANADD